MKMNSSHWVLSASLALALGACGATATEDEGTESHWLSACSKSSDCEQGICACGACTELCDQVSDCPSALDSCSAPGTDAFGASCDDVPDFGLCGYEEQYDAPVAAQTDAGADAGRSEIVSDAGQQAMRLALPDGGAPQSTPSDVHDDAGRPQGLQNAPPSLDGGLQMLEPSVPAPKELPETPEEQVITTCEQGRVTTLSHTEGLSSALRAVPDGNGNFLMLYFTSATSELIRVAANGEVLQVLPPRSQFSPVPQDAVVLPSGETVVAGVTAEGRPWLGLVDVNWELVWELRPELDGTPVVNLALLPDGDLMLGMQLRSGASESMDHVKFFKFTSDGDVLWERAASFDGFQGVSLASGFMAVTEDGVARIIAETENGLRMVGVDEAGVLSEVSVEAPLALYFTGAAALPGNLIAIASARVPGAVLSVIDADGQTLWEQNYDAQSDAAPNGIAYDPTRGEVLLAGEFRGDDGGQVRTWLLATDLDGERRWSLTREPEDIDIDGALLNPIDAEHGQPVMSVAVDNAGVIIAPSWTSGLTFFAVGTETCEQ